MSPSTAARAGAAPACSPRAWPARRWGSRATRPSCGSASSCRARWRREARKSSSAPIRADLSGVREPRPRGMLAPTGWRIPMIGKQAVVIGAGMGGPTAAGALADHFERVIVLEKDALPREAADRVGVPQGKHVHALLAGGQQALDNLFPDFTPALVKGGAVPIRVGLDIRMERLGFDPF